MQLAWVGRVLESRLGLVWVSVLETKTEISPCCMAWVQITVTPGLKMSRCISGIAVWETHPSSEVHSLQFLESVGVRSCVIHRYP